MLQRIVNNPLSAASMGRVFELLKRAVIAIVAAAIVLAAVFVGVKAEVIRPNMLFPPSGVRGVDVSEHQGAIDVEALSGAGIQFVYAKATEGATYVDTQFPATCERAQGSNIALGAYHFFSFDSSGDAQAASFIAAVQSAWNDTAIHTLRPAVAVEWYGDKERNPPETDDVRRELREFVDAVEKACGSKPLIYVGNDIYDRYIRGYFDDCELWISCRKWPAWVEWPQGGWAIWQYSNVGEVPGAANAAGHVDLNVLAEGLSVKDLLL